MSHMVLKTHKITIFLLSDWLLEMETLSVEQYTPGNLLNTKSKFPPELGIQGFDLMVTTYVMRSSRISWKSTCDIFSFLFD